MTRVIVSYESGGMPEVRHVYEGRVIEEDDNKIVIKSGRYPWTFFKSAAYVTIERDDEYEYGVWGGPHNILLMGGFETQEFAEEVMEIWGGEARRPDLKVVKRLKTTWEDV